LTTLDQGVRALLALPRGRQLMAAKLLLKALPEPVQNEVWNTSFGPESLYEAWSQTQVAQGVYAANISVLRPLLDKRRPWRVIEVGAGNGMLWRRLLRPDDVGEIVAVDPVAGALDALADQVPAGVRVVKRVGHVETVDGLGEADAVVCSLTLHHVAGRSAEERARYGLDGVGKREVLSRFCEAVRSRDGVILLCEADVHCEIDLPAGHPALRDRLFDSYVRRCGPGLLADIARSDISDDLRARFRHILRHWCLEQVAMADLPRLERDVYELDVGRWREVIAAAGLELIGNRCTDEFGLFWQYQARASSKENPWPQ
jgi:hypothetical protein